MTITILATMLMAQCPDGSCRVAYQQPAPVYYTQPQAWRPRRRWGRQAAIPVQQPAVYQPVYAAPAQPIAQAAYEPAPVIAPAAAEVIGPAGTPPATAGSAQAAVAVSSEAAGFLAWLNGVRATSGLPAVGYDLALEGDCHQNNLWQAAIGMGHHFFGAARRQNAAFNLGFPGVEIAWLASPGHCSALLDPSISRIAITWYAGYCTYAAR